MCSVVDTTIEGRGGVGVVIYGCGLVTHNVSTHWVFPGRSKGGQTMSTSRFE